MGAEIVFNHADYRLVSSKALKHFADFKEVNLFLRGFFPLVGFKSTSVYYERSERLAGESHYPLRKMLALAFDGITSLSVKPINLITGIGGIFGVAGLITLIISLIVHCIGNNALIGFIFGSIVLFAGIQLVATGIVGSYVGKCYMETKARPRYIISERTGEANDSEN